MADTLPLADRLAAFQAVVSQHPTLTARDRANLRELAVRIEPLEERRSDINYAHLMRCQDKHCVQCRDNELAA